MKKILKKFVNGVLELGGFKMIRLPRERISGAYLFEDIRKIVGIDSPLCLDVGANCGQTIDALLEVFDSPRIYSFEPAGKTFRILSNNNYPPTVKLYNLAMGESEGHLEFINYTDSRLSSFLSMDVTPQNPFSMVEESEKEIVPVDTVDAFCEKNNLDMLDLLKIDTQGFDFQVLKGAANLIENEKINCIMLEMNFVRMYCDQGKPEEIIGYLSQNNYFLVDLYEKEMCGNRLGWCTALFVSAAKSGGALK